ARGAREDVRARDAPGALRGGAGERSAGGAGGAHRGDALRARRGLGALVARNRARVGVGRGRELGGGGGGGARGRVPRGGGDAETPVVVSAIDLCAFIALAMGLRGPLGHVGISVAVAGSSAVQMALLFAGLRRRLGTVCAREIGASALRTAAASAIAAVG